MEQPFCHLHSEIQQKVHSAVLSGQQILRFRPLSRCPWCRASKTIEKSVFSGQQVVEEHLVIIGCTNNVPAPVHNTHTLWHTPSHFALRENVFSCLCPKKSLLFDWRRACSPENFQQSTVSWVYFRRVGKEGGSWYIVCTANNYEMFFNLLLARKNTFFNSFALISLNYNPYRNHNFAKIPLPKS